MFKKIITNLLCLLMVCTILTGCETKTNQASISKKLDKNLNNLRNIVTKLDTIDNNYIQNPNLSYTTNNTKNTIKISVFNNKIDNDYNVNKFENQTDNTENIIQEILKDEIQKRFNLNNNGYCNNCNYEYNCDSDGYCTNCKSKVYCNQDNTCYYCNNPLNQNQTNTCQNCNESYLISKTSLIDETAKQNQDNSITALQNDTDNKIFEYNITDITDSEYSIIQLDNENKNNNKDKQELAETEAQTSNDNQIDSENKQVDSLKSEQTLQTDTTIGQSKNVNTTNELYTNSVETQANKKIDTDTQNNTSDVANQIVVEPINDINPTTTNNQKQYDNNNDNLSFNSENINNTPTTSSNKNYYYTNESFEPAKLRYNPRYINSYNESEINDQLSSYLYKVQRLYAITEDALEANNILRTTQQELLNKIDELIDLNQDIMNGKHNLTIQQLQALNNYAYDISRTTKNLKRCNGDLENEISNIGSNIQSNIASSVDVMNSNYVKLINLIDTRITYHRSAISTLEQIKYLFEDIANQTNVGEIELENSLNTTNELIEDIGKNEDENNSYKDITIYTENETIKNEDNTGNNMADLNNSNNTINNDIELPNTTKTTTAKKSIKNIDTYKSSITPSQNNIIPFNENQDYEQFRLADQSNTNTNVCDNNQYVCDSNYNAVDNIVNNNANNLINEGFYKNSVINQNNLNNNDGYGGYYYANDGQIHNNGINGNNEFGNNGNTIENNLNRNNNTNTYGYNTMLDILNQGTVNNGINTL